MRRFRRDCSNLLREMSVRDMRRKVKQLKILSFQILVFSMMTSLNHTLNKHKYSDIVIKLKIYDPNVCDIM